MNRRKRILIVEDDRTIARGLKELLQAEGHAVRVVDNGEEGLARSLASAPDLMVLDVNLPRMNGLEVCRRLRSHGVRNPVILLTARAQQIDKVIGLDAGADDYVTKPFNAHEVLARVRAHLRRFEINPSSTRDQLADKAATGQTRKLLSVMFTDMKDFSKRMNEDEKSALVLLKRHNDALTRAVTSHGGRIVEIIGDAFLVSFESALNAVECGMSIQRRFKKYNARRKASKQLHERIGVHLGDVIEVSGKLRGDTVNIAARLQQLAAPDSMYVSESVFRATMGKIDVQATRLGRRRVKNIKESITIYRFTN
jgi:DNA-binding response OmpR family regulator